MAARVLPANEERLIDKDGRVSPKWRGWFQRLDAALGALETTVGAGSFQPLDATLTALAGLATGASKVPYSTGTDVFGQLDLDTDGTLAGNSDTRLATQKAVKTYADTLGATKQSIPTASNGFPIGTPAYLEYTGTTTLADGATTTSVRHAVAYNDDAGTTTPLVFKRGAGAVPGGTWMNITGASLDGNGSNNACYGTFKRTA